ncbi:hypothetical protein OROHE_009636 [Orobanche hederae]
MKAGYFPPKEDVILQNEAPTDFYILVTGAMELLVSKNKVEQVYGEAKTGDLCGEYRPQLFTVRTKRLGQLLHLNRATFLSIVQANVGDGTIFLNNLPQHLKELKDPVMEGVLVKTENMLDTSPAHLDDYLGLDSFKFQSKSTEAVVNELGASLLSGLDADERYRADGVSTSNFWCKLCCPKCPEENESARLSPALLATQVKRQAEGFISRYYNRMMMCEDETCKYTTRSLNMEVLGDSERGIICPNYPCFNGRLVTHIPKEICTGCYILATVPCTEKGNSKIVVEKEEVRIRPVVELAAKTVQKMKDKCSYGWVMPNDLTVSI